MKKLLLSLGCLLVLGLVASPEKSAAEEIVQPVEATSFNFSGLTRGAPLYREVTIASGSAYNLEVGALKNDNFVSKYVIKFKVESNQKESILYSEFDNTAGWVLNNRNYYFTNEEKAVYKTTLEDSKVGNRKLFQLINYSANPVKVKFAVSSALHLTAIPCVDYSDIDFDL